MQRSGPRFAKSWGLAKNGTATPRGTNPNPLPRGSGIIDRMKRAAPEERKHIAEEALQYELISPRTKRRVKQLI